MSDDPHLIVSQEGEVTRINFRDRSILEETTIQSIGEDISLMIEEAVSPKLLISFTGVEHLSSAALGTLITINNKIRQKGGQLRLSDIHEQIYEVFVITRLDKLFQIHETADTAAESFT